MNKREHARVVSSQRAVLTFNTLPEALAFAGMGVFNDQSEAYSFIIHYKEVGQDYYVVASHRISVDDDQYNWYFSQGYRYRKVREGDLIEAIKLLHDIAVHGVN